MKFFFGGYYLLRLKPLLFGTEKGILVYSSSECINDNLVGSWSYAWLNDSDEQAEEAKENLQLTDELIESIRDWVAVKQVENKLAWPNIFSDIDSMFEYRRRFFSHIENVATVGLYFDEESTEQILKQFKPTSNQIAEIGLRSLLSQKLEEFEKENEDLIGYDFIGVDIAGSFHTFYCHDKARELEKKFGLSLNSYGLFDSSDNVPGVLEYINTTTNGFEPDPWFAAKTKLVIE
ncbi:MAG: hypothetical protein EOP48_07255 [Sphingobacteriales bacterium]|nr:MAG: hypothetical protein EOP48_07255 [Sphingobacteriales bacterium]